MQPSDEGGDDRKVVPLFPAEADAVRPPESPIVSDAPDELSTLRAEARTLLKHSQPAREPIGPRPEHRNATRCPQCDQYTWRETERCIHCGKNLVAHAARTAAEQHAQRQGLIWSCALLSWAVALACIYLSQHYALPPGIHLALRYAVFAIVGVNLLGFWIASMDKRP